MHKDNKNSVLASFLPEKKVIPVVQYRKFFSELPQFLYIQFHPDNGFISGRGTSDLPPPGIGDHRITGIGQTVIIFSDTIDASNKSLIFNRSGFQQCFPDFAARFRPIRHENSQIIILCVPAPNREAQIITNKSSYLYSPKFESQLPVSGSKMFIL